MELSLKERCNRAISIFVVIIAIAVSIFGYIIVSKKFYDIFCEKTVLKIWLGWEAEYTNMMSPLSNELRFIRGMTDNFTTAEEAYVLKNLLDNQELVPQSLGDLQVYGFNIRNVIASKTVDHESKSFLYRLRVRILEAVRTHFNDSEIYMEYTHLTKRLPGMFPYSQPLHADNCLSTSFKGPCIATEKHCCSWRSHTAFLYLNEPDGGDFIFRDGESRYTIVKPQTGRLLMLSSGGENIHGVSRVQSGARYALGMWFTKEYDRSSSIEEQNFFVGTEGPGLHKRLT